VSSDGEQSTAGPGVRRSGWRGLLALLSLSLASLIWLGGLVDSLQRPSVGDALGLRQLELNVIVAEVLPTGLQATLLGDDPRADLRTELERQLQQAPVPPPVAQRLERALLQPAAVQPVALRDLEPVLESIDPRRRPLLQALIDGDTMGPAHLEPLLRPWSPSPVLAQLWQWRRGLLAPAAPLVAPPLDGLDLVLLIAGGFVVLGEVLAPLLLAPLLERSLRIANLAEPLSQGLQVLGQYLALTIAPLAILSRQIATAASRQPRPPGGWLQWRWRPLATAASSALAHLLMVLPLVALAGWLQEQLVGDPGGSNPLLELVLNSGDRLALGCFALTAVIVAPLFEETIFRGVLLPVAGRRFGGGAAVLLSAVVFAVAHLSLGELVPLLVLGLGLGWLRWRTGRLGPCVILHALWNAVTFANLIALGS
jgi:membrane protease YdiL (CAAX protease family)